MRLKILCPGEHLGAPGEESPKEITQSPCHTTQVAPQVRILALALAAMGSTMLWPGRRVGWGHLAQGEEGAVKPF